MQKTPYDILGGEEGLRKLCAAFYHIMDTSDQTVEIRAMYGESLAEIEAKLCDYLTTWLGGPNIWTEKNGGMCLTDSHAPYKIGPKVRDQWLFCMEKALEEVKASEEVRNLLKEPFWGIANMVKNSTED